MPNRLSTAIVALLSALSGGVAVAAYYESRSEHVRAEEAFVSLSDHSSAIVVLHAGDTRMALRFLTTLADADVMRLMTFQQNPRQASDFGRKALLSYGEFRRSNPQFYGVPDYVAQEGRAEYEKNLRDIQAFLDQAQPARQQP